MNRQLFYNPLNNRVVSVLYASLLYFMMAIIALLVRGDELGFDFWVFIMRPISSICYNVQIPIGLIIYGLMDYVLWVYLIIWLLFPKVSLSGNYVWVVKFLGDPDVVVTQGDYLLPFARGRWKMFSVDLQEKIPLNFNVPITMRTIFNQEKYNGWSISDSDILFVLKNEGRGATPANFKADSYEQLRKSVIAAMVNVYRMAIHNYSGVSEMELINSIKHAYNKSRTEIKRLAHKFGYEVSEYNTPLYALIDPVTRMIQVQNMQAGNTMAILMKAINDIMNLAVGDHQKMTLVSTVLSAANFNVPVPTIKQYVVDNNHQPLLQMLQ